MMIANIHLDPYPLDESNNRPILRNLHPSLQMFVHPLPDSRESLGILHTCNYHSPHRFRI